MDGVELYKMQTFHLRSYECKQVGFGPKPDVSGCSRTGSGSNSEPVPVPTRNLVKGADFEGEKKIAGSSSGLKSWKNCWGFGLEAFGRWRGGGQRLKMIVDEVNYPVTAN